MKKWIQKAKPKKGALSRQLHIAESKNIPTALLQKISKATEGARITAGKQKLVTVTSLMKKRANFALNVRRR